MTYVIVNECDRPCERLVAQIVDDRAFYMMRALDEKMKQYDGMDIRSATDVADFGFEIIEDASAVRFRKVDASKATYKNDGNIREWQGADYFMLPMVDLFADPALPKRSANEE